MPELPEVETTRRGITPFLLGQAIECLIVRQPRLRYPVPDNINQICQNQSIKTITRRAKYLIIGLSRGCLLIHLGMSGHLRIAPPNSPPQKHDHIDLVLKNGVILRYCDPRRFGFWLYLEEKPEEHRFIQTLGPEPLTDAFNADYLVEKAKNKHLPIKSFIMRHDIVVGVGNIYAAESLYLSGIHPKRSAGSIQFNLISELVNNIKKILEKAILAGGTTLQDFYNSQGKPGYFSQSLQIYGRLDQPCFQCQTRIKNIKINGRSSFFCPQCQPERE